LCNFGLWICLPVLIVSFFKNIVLFELTIRPTILALFYVWLVSRAAEGFRGTLGKILELKPLVFVGKLSYGLYVIHYFMIPLFGKIFEYFNVTDTIPLSVAILLKTLATFAIAIPSWFWFEKPINDLKHRFGYEK
jgi:peptidoglycan/LPS O-acetylase OafA/YrhL